MNLFSRHQLTLLSGFFFAVSSLSAATPTVKTKNYFATYNGVTGRGYGLYEIAGTLSPLASPTVGRTTYVTYALPAKTVNLGALVYPCYVNLFVRAEHAPFRLRKATITFTNNATVTIVPLAASPGYVQMPLGGGFNILLTDTYSSLASRIKSVSFVGTSGVTNANSRLFVYGSRATCGNN